MDTLVYALGDDVRERALANNIVRLECPGCDEHASVADPEGIARLIEHARRGHATVQSLLGISVGVVLSPVEIIQRVGE